ncbi:hypothetical protein AXY43_15805 [Clostridium sp. MF28]|uniref:GNAT family N-acetyltransferase n=1 Tax=Clostridium TaxID=1485 RepID=UPI000CF8746B|nr:MULTISPECIES: GNAT family N-acetyltransferase [Clostridium]AVK49345.1 hypothetical protein AXY43_15805 [Clostridium sp. MF28]PSM58041.1 GNAT family N-acetyltransferase [Clostridium diolis]
MIRLALESDIDKIEQSYVELLTHENKYGSNSNWVLDVYPTRKVAIDSLSEGTLYVLDDNNQVCVSMILNQIQPDEYKVISWKYPAELNEVLVIHTLCVPPSKAGNGYGKKMILYAIEKAKEMKCKSIRLDTFAGNKPAANLYTGLGFLYSGIAEVMLQGVIREQQIFFEMRIGE